MMHIGMLILALGAMMGDSENLIIPTLFLTVGAALMLIGQRRDEDGASDETSETGH